MPNPGLGAAVDTVPWGSLLELELSAERCARPGTRVQGAKAGGANCLSAGLGLPVSALMRSTQLLRGCPDNIFLEYYVSAISWRSNEYAPWKCLSQCASRYADLTGVYTRVLLELLICKESK